MIKDHFQKGGLLITIVIFLFAIVPALSQENRVGKRTVIDGNTYYLHEVEQGQGFYGIARKYNVSQKEILDANPDLEGGLKSGQIIRIPVIEGRNSNQDQIRQTGDFILHTVDNGQTVWFISRKYNVEVEDIFRHNPGARQNLTTGSIIKVPVKQQSTSEDTPEDDDQFKHHEVQSGETLYSLSRRYNVTVDDIVENNPALKTGVLSVGSIVRIPLESESPENKPSGARISESSNMEGKNFIYHEIQPGQTLYSIARRYQVEVDSIQHANPDLDPDDLEPGSILRVPREQKLVERSKPEKQDLFETHRVRRKETLFSISRRYDVDMEIIREINSKIDFSNLRRGTELKIPKDQWFVQQYSGRRDLAKKEEHRVDSLKNWQFEPSDSLCVNPEGIGTERPVKVALLLPFALDATEEANIIEKVERGDTIKTVRENRIIDSRSRVFAEFYEGVLLALNELKDKKIDVDLSVHDIAPNSAAVDRVLESNPELKDVDMIIGPARSDDLASVSAFALEHEIKVIYPLSNSNPELERNPYIFQVNTPDTLLFDRMTNEIVRQSEGYNLLAIIPEAEDQYAATFLDALRQKVFFNEFALNKDINYREYKMTGKGDQTNLEALLDPLKKNVVVIPTNQEITISKVVPTLAGISRKRKLDISLFGMTEWLRAQSIEPADMFTLNAQIFTFFAFDYDSPVTENFIRKYRRWYHTEPHAVSSYFQGSSNNPGYSRYGAWGYDVTNYFISAMAQGGTDFEYCPEPFDVEPVQFNFSFNRVSNWGGFYNQGIFMLKFMPDYKVERVPVLSIQPFMQ